MTQLKRFLKTKGVITLLAVALVLTGASSVMAEKTDKDKGSGKGFLGVSLERMSADERDEFKADFGVLVTRVSKGEAAEKAGIKKYDVIRYFNGEKMRRPGDLSEAVSEQKPGTNVKIKLIRDGKDMSVTAVLGELKHRNLFAYRFKGDKGKDGKLKWYFKDKDHKDKDHKDKDFDWHFKDGDRQFRFKTHGGAFLGVHLQSLEPADFAEYFGVKAGGGALITNVSEDSPAAKAGLKAGDVIVKLDGKDVSSPGDVSKIINKKEKGDKIDVRVVRHKKKKSFKAELAERKFHFKRLNKVFEGVGGHLKHLGEGMHGFHIEIPHMDKRGNHFIFKGDDLHDMKEHLEKIHEHMDNVKIEIKEKKKKLKEEVKKKVKEQKKLKKVKESRHI